MTLPNLIICGAPKSGTSSLYFWLEAHPEVCASRVKETFFYADDINRFNKKLNCMEHAIEDYSHQWDHCKGEKVVFEATAPYIYFKNALEKIKDLPTKPKLIFILREPAARLFSQYRFNKYKLRNTTATFMQYVSQNGNFASGQNFKGGVYYDFLKRWVDKYGKERIGIFLFEEMILDKTSFMKKIAQYIHIEPQFYDDYSFIKRNETVSLKSTALHRFGLKVQPYMPSRIQEALMPFYFWLNKGKAIQLEEGERELLEKLKDAYKSSNELLEGLFPDVNFSLWK
jgi:hypothetical protein